MFGAIFVFLTGINTGKTDEPGDRRSGSVFYWISVKDNGQGLDRNSYSAIFRRFEYSTNENGFGIGMPLALKIVKGQGGDIDVDFGGDGAGETFTIKLFK